MAEPMPFLELRDHQTDEGGDQADQRRDEATADP